MSRPKYKITASDLPFAHAYLSRAVEDNAYIVRGNARSHQFRQYLERIDLEDDPEFDADILNRWCEQYLTTTQWQRMKVSIRKMRYQTANKDITITLKPKAHAVLQHLVNTGKADSLSNAIIWLNSQVSSK